MSMCDRCRVSGCLLNYNGKACKNARKKECPDVVFTNADHIRSMSDVELRDLICSIQNLEGGVTQVTLDGYTWGLVDVEEWLGYEAEVKR